MSCLPALALLGFVAVADAGGLNTAGESSNTVVPHRALAALALGSGLQNGKAIYARLCSSCHGADGRGSHLPIGKSVPARDLTSRQAARELSRERMIRSVTDGRKGTAMGGFGTRLLAQDIEAVVDYVRSEFMVADPKKPGAARSGIRGINLQHPTARSYNT